MFFLLVLTLTVPIHDFVDIPQYFRGSPEIFSGYLPDSDIYIKSFSYQKGLVIEGSAQEVENILAKSDPNGK